ncbi:MAG TPA: hypothetical protein VNW06_07230 [Cytophagaceae bacterium]|jgi:hypothetical protein|nr:hypothetical protein [Cytophagaceae bacterium]
MHHFIADIDLINPYSEDFVSLIPFQREKIDTMMGEGVIVSYSLSVDRSKLWVTFIAATEAEVYELIATFPLIEFMEPTVYELAFHNSISNNFPVISLN